MQGGHTISNEWEKGHTLSTRSQSQSLSISSSIKSPDASDIRSLRSVYNSDSPPNTEAGNANEDRHRKRKLWAKVCSCCKNYFEGISATDPSNLRFNPIDPGNWDEWGVYYCSSRFGRHTKFNPSYFALAAVIVVGQSDLFHLIHLMQENGGAAFLVVLFFTYISFGYLTYLLETTLGQYTGMKPIAMIRLMAPLFSGLGVALYIRTFFRAINILGYAGISLFHFWDLLFCKGPQSVLLRRIVKRERDYRTFIPFLGLYHPYLTLDTEEEFGLDKILIFICSLFLLLSFTKMKDYGAGMMVVVRLLLLFLAGYTFNGYLRINPSVKEFKPLTSDSVAYLPMNITFGPTWPKIVSGKTWLVAIIFVMRSLELDTLVHPYLGSKVFYHYRSARDGIYLVLFAFTWNVIGILGIVLWLGYVGINKAEIKSSWKEVDGHYGMFVVFVMKHIQAEMTQEVESDVLFYCSLFYFITGLAALIGVVCYLYVLTDCSYAESGHPMTKVIVLVWYIFLFGIVLFPLMTSDDGVRHLIFLHYYGSDPWVGIFLIICFTFAVSWSQGMARVLHDFYNIIHLKGYEVMTHFHQVPAIVAVLFTGYPFIAMMLQAVYRTRLTSGASHWNHPVTWFLGYYITMAPVLAVIFGAFYYLLRERNDVTTSIFAPHRDFYKNKHHIAICFKDYENFDPDKLPHGVRFKRHSTYQTTKTPT